MPSDGSDANASNEALEVVVLEVEVGVELDHHLRQLVAELGQAGHDPAHDRAAAGSRRRLE